MKFTQADIDRFMKHVDKLPSGCWFWMGARSRGRSKKWYGTFFVSRSVGRVRAHRFSCEAIGGKGSLPPGHDRSHQCDFSMCVNPGCILYEPKQVNQERRLERARKAKDESKQGRSGARAGKAAAPPENPGPGDPDRVSTKADRGAGPPDRGRNAAKAGHPRKRRSGDG